MSMRLSFPLSSTPDIQNAKYCELARQVAKTGDELLENTRRLDRTEPGERDVCLEKHRVLLTRSVDDYPGYVQADFRGGKTNFRMREVRQRVPGAYKRSTWTQDWRITRQEDGVTIYELKTSCKRHEDWVWRGFEDTLAPLLPKGKVVVIKRAGNNQHPDLEMIYGRENVGQYAGRKAREMAPYARAAWTTTGNAVASGRRALGAFAQAWREAGQENTANPPVVSPQQKGL